jgi:HAD superfamily hydrolase (TIGR01509 family)
MSRHPSFRLIIFDLDDTLVSSAATWQQAEARLFRRLGHAYDPAIANQYKGMNALDVGRTIHRILHPPTLTGEDCAQLLRAYLLEEYATPLPPMPGADALLRALAGRYPLCVASGSPLEGIQTLLHRCGWDDLFAFGLSSEGVAHGKPAPDIFLAAAQQGDCAPADALVIEDSLHGVRAAKAAGMTCYVVPSSTDPAIPALADATFNSLADLIPRLGHPCPAGLKTGES